MSESSEPKVLIVGEAAAQRWAEILRAAGAHVWLGPNDAPDDQQPEIVLTDSRPWEGPDETGVIRIGAVGPADLHLPEDCSARELQLACRLLAQIVRLRRRVRLAAETHHQLSVAALTDPLTGLPNRRAWDAALAQRMAVAADAAGHLCLAILDLDHFKRINDTLGHAVGDEVLRESGRAVYDSLRHDDFVARLGGDEFGLLLWVPNEAVAAVVVERVRTALPTRLVRTPAPEATASAGYCLWGSQAGAESGSQLVPEALYTAADAALREAKRRGRNRTVAG
jgi:diguanylate cyclase (GGDEF)-like protein